MHLEVFLHPYEFQKKRLQLAKTCFQAFESSCVATITGFVERFGTEPGRINRDIEVSID
jgi:hypothetical protein